MKSIFSRITHHASRITHHASRITRFNFKLLMCTFFVFFGIISNANAQCRAQFANYSDFTVATVKVNFHFLPINPTYGVNYTQLEAETIATALVELANDNMANLIASNLPTSVPTVPDSKIRFQLFDGGLGSVFTYPGNYTSVNYTPRYGQQVLDIVVSYYNCTSNTASAGANLITLCNFDRSIVTNPQLQYERALVLCHEMGHTFNLDHTFDCSNQCSSEIDHAIECGGSCGCGTPTSPSNNMMSYSGGNNALTPCQWSTMFNYIIASDPPFVTWNYDNCSTTNNNLTITNNSVWDTPKFLRQNIVIESGASLIIKCKVKMGVNNTITVKRGARLIVDGGTISNLCSDNTWGGIYVWGNSNLVQPDPTSIPSSNQAGILFLKNNAIIEGTRTAISSGRRDDGTVSWYDLTQSWGGVIYANNATFRNMTRAVEFLSYHCPSGTCIDDDKSAFIDCIFVNNTSIPGAQGVTIWDTNGITFEGCSFTGFQDGILTYDAGLEIKRSSQFYKDPKFENNVFGLNMIATYPNSFGASVSNAKFNNNNFGINSTASNSLRRHIFRLNEFYSPYYDIYLSGTSWFTIEKNVMSSATVGIGLQRTGSGITDNFIKCNTISGSQAGISIYRENEGLKILGNTFSANSYDDVDLVSSFYGTKIAPSQGSPASAAGNSFSSSTNNIIAISHGNTRNVPNTTFTYYLPNTVTPTTNSNLVPRCNLTDISLLPSPPNCFSGSVNKFQVLVNASPSTTNCTESGGFDDEGGDEYVFYALRAEVDNLVRVTANGRNRQLNSDLTEKSAKKNNMLNGLLKKAITSKDIKLAKRLLNDEQDDDNKKKMVGVCFSLKDWQEAKVFLNGLSNQIESWRDFKSVQLINLDRLKSTEKFKLTPNQRRTLLEIVEKEDVDNSSYAKAILQLVEGIRFEPRVESSVHSSNSAFSIPASTSNAIAEFISMTPNPAKDQLSFKIPTTFKVRKIEIFTVTGHLFKVFDVENENIVTDTQGMQNGMYIVKFVDEQGIPKQITKLFINK